MRLRVADWVTVELPILPPLVGLENGQPVEKRPEDLQIYEGRYVGIVASIQGEYAMVHLVEKNTGFTIGEIALPIPRIQFLKSRDGVPIKRLMTYAKNWIPRGAAFVWVLLASLAYAGTVKDYGAVGNGIADDTQAFVQAWNSEKVLRVPAGTYNLSNSLWAPDGSVSIIGEGQGVSILRWTSRGGLFFRPSSVSYTVTIQDISLETSIGNGTAIDARWVTPRQGLLGSGVRISGVDIRPSNSTGYWGAGIYLYQSSGAVIERFTILGHLSNPFICDPGIRADGDTTPVMIAHGTIQHCVAGIVHTGSEGLSVNQVEIVGGRWGIMRFGNTGGGTAIVGCHTNTTDAGIFMDGSAHQTQVIGNLIYRWGRTDNWVGIRLANASDGAVVSGNWIAPIDWVGNRYGIVLTNASNIIVSNNVIHGMTNPVWVQYGSGNMVLFNRFVNSGLLVDWGGSYVFGNY